MSSNQEPEVVVVTGAAGGAGRAIAHAFAERVSNAMATVFACFRDATAQESPALKLRQEPPA